MQQTTPKGNFKIWLIIGLGIAAIAMLGRKSQSAELEVGKANPDSKTGFVVRKYEKPKSWENVYNLTGNGIKTTDDFHLSGERARITYSYHSTNTLGLGHIAVNLQKANGLNSQLLFMTDVEQMINEISYFTASEGDYHLAVSAMGSWEVTVQEYR